MDELVEQEQVGVVLRTFDGCCLPVAAVKALALTDDETIHARAQEIARWYFDLITVGGRGYVDVYQRLVEQSRG